MTTLMDKKIIPTALAPAPIGPYSQAVWSNGTLYMSGQIAIDPSTNAVINGDVAAEAHQVMRNIRAVLEAYQLDYSHIIKTSIFLTTMDDFGTVNEVYGSYFTGDYPARETVAVVGLPKGVRVEISCIAVG
jgi:2-iminobutanoate/2-iminopropanoate deaminase